MSPVKDGFSTPKAAGQRHTAHASQILFRLKHSSTLQSITQPLRQLGFFKPRSLIEFRHFQSFSSGAESRNLSRAPLSEESLFSTNSLHKFFVSTVLNDFAFFVRDSITIQEFARLPLLSCFFGRLFDHFFNWFTKQPVNESRSWTGEADF